MIQIVTGAKKIDPELSDKLLKKLFEISESGADWCAVSGILTFLANPNELNLDNSTLDRNKEDMLDFFLTYKITEFKIEDSKNFIIYQKVADAINKEDFVQASILLAGVASRTIFESNIHVFTTTLDDGDYAKALDLTYQFEKFDFFRKITDQESLTSNTLTNKNPQSQGTSGKVDILKEKALHAIYDLDFETARSILKFMIGYLEVDFKSADSESLDHHHFFKLEDGDFCEFEMEIGNLISGEVEKLAKKVTTDHEQIKIVGLNSFLGALEAFDLCNGDKAKGIDDFRTNFKAFLLSQEMLAES